MVNSIKPISCNIRPFVPFNWITMGHSTVKFWNKHVTIQFINHIYIYLNVNDKIVILYTIAHAYARRPYGHGLAFYRPIVKFDEFLNRYRLHLINSFILILNIFNLLFILFNLFLFLKNLDHFGINLICFFF